MMTTNAYKNDLTRYPKDKVVLQGYYRKLKTMKKKYFVLYEENDFYGARLEYFDSEKKFKSKATPKRIIKLKQCFNINRRLDRKHEHVIELSTNDGCFDIVMDSEADMNKWLNTLLQLQRGVDTLPESLRPNFEHVWQVRVQRKGLAEEKSILGCYHVCLTAKSITLIRIGPEKTSLGEIRVPTIEFFLTTIRRCGDSQCLFYMEVGRHSVIGAGELWMETDDSLIAQSMHRMILNAMSSKKMDDAIGPMRKRSSSANEASKPISVLQRRQTHSGVKTMNTSPLNGRDRCDSLPSSRNRTTSECSNISTIISLPPSRSIPGSSNRPHSMYSRHSHSPPLNALSPSTGCSESEGSSLSVDETDEGGNFVPYRYNSLSTDGAIPEENTDDICTEYNKQNNLSSAISIAKEIDEAEVTMPVYSCLSHEKMGTQGVLYQAATLDLQSQYVDMYSSCGSSSYSAVSPGMEDALKNTFTGSCGGHSRASSFAEEFVDGYVPMAPILASECNVNQASKSLKHLDEISSNSSTTSGISSADIRFRSYSFEKTSSGLVIDSELEQSSNERPVRAYSVGSRPDYIKRKLRVDVPNNSSEESNFRVRAFSVGSRAKVPRCDIQRFMQLPSLSAINQVNNIHVNENFTNVVSLTSNHNAFSRGKNFSSAPILVQKTHNTTDKMSDLMEIDFSKNVNYRKDPVSSTSSKVVSFPINIPCIIRNRCEASNNISRGNTSTNKFIYNISDSAPMSLLTTDRSYLEMKPISCSTSPIVDNSPSHLLSLPEESLSLKTVSNARHSRTMHTNIENYSKSVNSMSLPSIPGKKDNINFNKTLIGTSPGYMIMSCESKSFNNANKKIKKQPDFHVTEKERETFRSSSNNQSLSVGLEACEDICLLSKETENKHIKLTPEKDFNSNEHKQNNKTNMEISGKFDTMITDSKHSSEKDLFIKKDLCSKDMEYLENVYANLSLNTNHIAEIRSNKNLEFRDFGPFIKLKTNHHTRIDQNQSKEELESNKSFNKDDDCNEFQPIFYNCVKTCIDSSDIKYPNNISAQKFTVPLSCQSSDLGYEILHIRGETSLHSKRNFSRPSSVNSEKISPLKGIITRPSSANSDCFQSISASSSSSTLCGSSSSSSTLCGSKSQSPLSTSRPHSIGDQFLNTVTNVFNDVCSNSSSTEQSNTLLRPSSISSERDLHYASLVLPPSSSNSLLECRVNKNSEEFATKGYMSNMVHSNINSTISCTQPTSQATFTYAKIAFNQRE